MPVAIVQPKFQNQEENVSCCDQFGKNLKVSSCFIISCYTDCIKGCDNTVTTHTTITTGRDEMGNYYTKTREHTTMSAKECSQCLCLCGLIPLAAQTALLPFTFAWSAIDSINKSCKEKK